MYCNGTTCISNSAVWDASVQLGYFHNIKCQRGFKSTLAFTMSHEAFRRMAVCTVQLTGNHTRPASRGTFRATAVKSRPSRMSPYAPARLRRAGRVQGGERKRASSGCNRRRRLATGSRQPKRGFGTAVPKTTIEVAESVSPS